MSGGGGGFDRDLLQRSLKWVKTEHERTVPEWHQGFWVVGLESTGEVVRLPLRGEPLPIDEFRRSRGWQVMRAGCGTAYCVAGHVVAEAGDRFVSRVRGHESGLGRSGYCMAEDAGEVTTVGMRAAELLGVNDDEAEALFSATNSYEEIVDVAREICENHGEELSFDE